MSAERAESRTAGVGIGLALVRELVQLMNGALVVQSAPGAGSTFTVALPVVRREGQAAAAAVTQAPTPMKEKGKKAQAKEEKPLVLLVEDNDDVVYYLCSCLEADYRVDVARDGQAGVDKAVETIPDLIVSDVMMPRMDGFELCHTLKTDERTSHIPIVLLTARADVDSRIIGYRRGADDYLAKPFDREELLARLDNLIALRRRLQARYAAAAAPPPPSEEPAVQIEDAFLTKVHAIIEAHLDEEKFGVQELLQEVHLSQPQFYRKIKALTGRTPVAYLRGIRLAHARRLLETTDMTVSQIAYAVGFQSLAYFSTVFREEYGVRPSGVRVG